MVVKVAVRELREYASTFLTVCYIVLLVRLEQGACTVQPTSISFSSEELIDMIERCGLNSLIQFPTYLSIHLKRARQDPKLLSLLRGLKDIQYGGLPLSREDEDWAEENGLKLQASFNDPFCGMSSDFVPELVREH
jgi:hypothetical protein